MKTSVHRAPARVFISAATALAIAAAGCRDSAPRQLSIPVGDRAGALVLPAALAGQLSAAGEIVRKQFHTAWRELNLADPRSDASKINRAAGTYRFHVSFDTYRAIDLAHYYSRRTGGAFDLTVLPAMEAWGLAGPTPDRVPDDDERAALRELMGPELIHMAEQGAIALLKPGVRIAPGSLPFAYGVDLAIVELRRKEIDKALVTWDRYARALGRKDAETPWRYPIRNPFAGPPLGEIALDPFPALAVIGLRDQTVAIGDRIYGGIIDPRSAQPAEGVALVAVRAPTCMMAHALAHALLVLGVEEGTPILNEFPECDVLLVPDSQPLETWATAGWLNAFTPSAALFGKIRTWARPERAAIEDKEAETE